MGGTNSSTGEDFYSFQQRAGALFRLEANPLQRTSRSFCLCLSLSLSLFLSLLPCATYVEHRGTCGRAGDGACVAQRLSTTDEPACEVGEFVSPHSTRPQLLTRWNTTMTSSMSTLSFVFSRSVLGDAPRTPCGTEGGSGPVGAHRPHSYPSMTAQELGLTAERTGRRGSAALDHEEERAAARCFLEQTTLRSLLPLLPGTDTCVQNAEHVTMDLSVPVTPRHLHPQPRCRLQNDAP